MRTINVKKNGKIYEMSFSFKYWFYLLVYLALVILARFIYTILVENLNYTGETTSTKQGSSIETKSDSICKFIGINYDYEMPFSVSLTKNDFAGLSIIWIAFMFATLQEDTYRSETY